MLLLFTAYQRLSVILWSRFAPRFSTALIQTELMQMSCSDMSGLMERRTRRGQFHSPWLTFFFPHSSLTFSTLPWSFSFSSYKITWITCSVRSPLCCGGAEGRAMHSSAALNPSECLHYKSTKRLMLLL